MSVPLSLSLSLSLSLCRTRRVCPSLSLSVHLSPDRQASCTREGQPTTEERSSQNALVPLEGDDDHGSGAGAGGASVFTGGGSGGMADAGAVVLLLACYQNLIGVLHTGLEASRWRPRPR